MVTADYLQGEATKALLRAEEADSADNSALTHWFLARYDRYLIGAANVAAVDRLTEAVQRLLPE